MIFFFFFFLSYLDQLLFTKQWRQLLIDAIISDHSCLTSDADDQLIVYIPFRSPVKLRSIKVEAPEGKPAPSNMKVYVNRPTVGFEEVEDELATQSFALDSGNLTSEGKPLQTHFAKFRQGMCQTLIAKAFIYIF